MVRREHKILHSSDLEDGIMALSRVILLISERLRPLGFIFHNPSATAPAFYIRQMDGACEFFR